MYRHVALVFAALVAVCFANPIADPYTRTHIRIHVPQEVHTVHHHHVETVPIIKEVPVVRTVPIVNTVHVPIVKTVAIEKPVFVPYREHSFLH